MCSVQIWDIVIINHCTIQQTKSVWFNCLALATPCWYLVCCVLLVLTQVGALRSPVLTIREKDRAREKTARRV